MGSQMIVSTDTAIEIICTFSWLILFDSHIFKQKAM